MNEWARVRMRMRMWGFDLWYGMVWGCAVASFGFAYFTLYRGWGQLRSCE